MRIAPQFPVALALALALALLLSVACGGASSTQSADRLVPSDANLIAEIQLGKILQDSDLQKLYDQSPKSFDAPATLEEALGQAMDETGIDFRSFQTAVMFADLAQDDAYVGIIAKGSFDEAKLVAAMEQEGDFTFTTSEYHGAQIHVDESDPDMPALSVLDGDTLVAGTLAAVQSVIDVRDGSMAAISGKVYDAFSGMGSPLVRLAVAVPPEKLADLDQSLGAGGGMGFAPAGLAAFQDLEVVAVLGDKDGDVLLMRADLDFRDAASATQVGDMIDGLVSLMSGLGGDQGMSALLKKLDVDVVDTRLTVKFQSSIAELQELADTLGNDRVGFAP